MRTTPHAMTLAVACLLATGLMEVNLGGQAPGRAGASIAASQKEELSETYRGSQRDNVELQEQRQKETK
jgi:hypothetical protein